jgi:hypothetical protein
MSNDAEFFPGISKTWGLSFQINTEKAPTGRPAGGLMCGPGWRTRISGSTPTTGVGGVYLSQVLPFADKKALPLYCAFESAIYETA